MKNISKSLIFTYSILSSLSLFLSVFYGQVLFRELWILFAGIQIVIIILFIIVLISSLVFWIRNTSYLKKYLPFLICSVSLIIVTFLPLTWIRNRINFFIDEKNYEKAVSIVRQSSLKENGLVALPTEYKFLSDGDVSVMTQQKQKAVLFYTFRGIPDGYAGFVKLDTKQNIDSLFDKSTNNIRNIGNNWYHVSGE